MRRSRWIVPLLAASVVSSLLMTGCGSAAAGGGLGGVAAGGPDDAVSTGTQPTDPRATSRGVASFQGTVTDALGRPVSGAMLQAISLASPPLPVPELAVITDARGHYAWHGLRPGPYAVSVSRGAEAAHTQLIVVDGQVTVADLVLR